MEWVVAGFLAWMVWRGRSTEPGHVGEHVRERNIILCVGAPGSGKTSIARTLYGRAMQRGARTVVYDPNDPARGIWPENLDDDLDTRLRARSVDMVVVDDVDNHLRRWSCDQSGPWRQIALRHRHLGIDVVLTARSTQNLPTDLLSAVAVLYVFNVRALDSNLRDRIEEVAPTAVIPTESFRFVAIDCANKGAPPRYGRTLPGGGFALDP